MPSDPEVRFTTCRACGCTCLDTPVGLLNPQARPLGTYDRYGALLVLDGVRNGHFLHRCPPKSAA